MSGKMRFNMARGPGLSSLLKSGYKTMSGVEEAIIKNIEACSALAEITRTSLGPNGMSKLVINHLEKVFITSDAATIVGELEIEHPAAKMLTMASKQQETEVGDGTNFVVTFAGELLANARDLLRMGVHPSDVVLGFKQATAKAMALLDERVVHTVEDPRNADQLALPLKSVIASKQYGFEDFLAPLVAKACIAVMPDGRNAVNVDNVRVSKLIGRTLYDSQVVKGLVVERDSLGSVKHVTNAKVAVFGCGIEAGSTETKGNVVLKDADDLRAYTQGEEKSMEDAIAAIAATGANVVIASGAISEIAMHYLEKYNLMVLKILSKFELRRLCRAVNATALSRLGAPTADELGSAVTVSVQELSSARVTVFAQEEDEDTGIATIVLRGPTKQILDDVERSINDAVNVAKLLCRNGACVAGAGACEIELALALQAIADECPGLEQYAIKKYAEALEVVARTLAETSGQTPNDVVSALYAAHTAGEANAGVDVSGEGLCDTVEAGVVDCAAIKRSALQLAGDVAATIMRVDQIIMAKRAGGPKMKGPQGSANSDYF